LEAVRTYNTLVRNELMKNEGNYADQKNW
jgi:hypothetical protein